MLCKHLLRNGELCSRDDALSWAWHVVRRRLGKCATSFDKCLNWRNTSHNDATWQALPSSCGGRRCTRRIHAFPYYAVQRQRLDAATARSMTSFCRPAEVEGALAFPSSCGGRRRTRRIHAFPYYAVQRQRLDAATARRMTVEAAVRSMTINQSGETGFTANYNKPSGNFGTGLPCCCKVSATWLRKYAGCRCSGALTSPRFNAGIAKRATALARGKALASN